METQLNLKLTLTSTKYQLLTQQYNLHHTTVNYIHLNLNQTPFHQFKPPQNQTLLLLSIHSKGKT